MSKVNNIFIVTLNIFHTLLEITLLFNTDWDNIIFVDFVINRDNTV